VCACCTKLTTEVPEHIRQNTRETEREIESEIKKQRKRETDAVHEENVTILTYSCHISPRHLFRFTGFTWFRVALRRSSLTARRGGGAFHSFSKISLLLNLPHQLIADLTLEFFEIEFFEIRAKEAGPGK